MIWLRQLVSYLVTLAVVIALVLIVPRFARLRVDPEYNDIANLDVDRSLNADTGFSFARLEPGDAVAYGRSAAAGEGSGESLCLGWIAGIPGDLVAIRGGKVIARGKPAAGEPVDQPDRPEVMVPAGHVFVVSSRHQFDSVASGFIPAAAIRGKLGSLP